jgi:hypothetical protein
MSEAVCGQIVDRADGVPLFIKEVTRAVLEVGGDVVPKATFPGSAAVPATLHASLTARLDRLGAIAREVAQTGAAIGREFSHDLLAAIAGLHENALGSALRRLEDAQLIHRRGLAPEAMYSFRHILLRDASYSTLLRELRRALHARIAAAIIRLRPEVAEREPQLLALHYAGAGLAELAIRYWQQAGEHRVAQFANREAIGHFERALELVEAVPPGAKRDRLEAELRLVQVVPLDAIHGFQSQLVEACVARANALGDRLPDWAGRFAVHRMVWNSCLVRQPVPRTLVLARDLLSLAEAERRSGAHSIACRALGFSLFQYGKPVEANPVLARGVAIADGVADNEFAIYGEDPRIICRLSRGLACCNVKCDSPGLVTGLPRRDPYFPARCGRGGGSWGGAHLYRPAIPLRPMAGLGAGATSGLSHLILGATREQAGEEAVVPPGPLQLAFH